jgi:hypothetical protein
MISVNHIPGFHEFYRAYVEAALRTSTTAKGVPLYHIYSARSFSEMARDCAKFLYDNARYVGDKYVRAGHDFWLTRNRSGAGFWDGDWPEPAATRLTDAAHAFGERLILDDDGVLDIYPGP